MPRNKQIFHKKFLSMALSISDLSTCLRRHVGALIVKNGVIISSGFNGSPKGYPNCTEVGTCRRIIEKIPSGERLDLCVAVHAEQNAMLNAARLGISIDGSIMYVTEKPCSTCLKMIINSGIKKVYYLKEYSDDLSEFIQKLSSIELIKLEI